VTRIALLLVVLTRVASADSRHVLVLRAEGTADTATREKVDTQVLKLAKALPDAKVDAGEIAFTDATVAAGCEPTDPTCKDQVLATMGVDELIATTADTAPGGDLKIEVRRLSKSSVNKAVTVVPAGQPPDTKMNVDIGPMFGLVLPPPPSAPRPFEPAPPPAQPPAPTPTTTAPPTLPTPEDHPPAPTQTAQTVTAAPDNQVPAPQDTGTSGGHSTLEWTGMIGGGVLALAGVVFWFEANDTQNQINAAPTKTSMDLQNLTNLESQGDSFAAAGNVLFISGAAIGLVSGYFFWRDHRSSDHHLARFVPTMLPHGGGIAIQFGGAP
jgi:hypothetical protein